MKYSAGYHTVLSATLRFHLSVFSRRADQTFFFQPVIWMRPHLRALQAADRRCLNMYDAICRWGVSLPFVA